MDDDPTPPMDPHAGRRGPRARSFERSHWEWVFLEAQRCQRGFACAVLMVEGVDGLGASEREGSIAHLFVGVERLIEERKQSREVLFGVEGERAYLAILGGDVQDAGCFAAGILRAAGSLAGFMSTPTPGLSIGVASNEASDVPTLDGLHLETLLCVAADGAEVAAASGGGRWAHTELYGLVQRRLETHGFQAPRARRSATARTVGPEPLPEIPEISESMEPPEVAPTPEHTVMDARPVVDTAPGTAAVQEPELESGWREILPALGRTDGAIERWHPRHKGEDGERSASDDGLLQLVLSVLEASGLSGSEAGTARRALLPLLERYLEAERARSAEENRDRVRLLERRIAKLKRQLSQLEIRTLEVPAEPEDSGLASTYRAVQGLSPADGQYRMKTHLLEAILHANLELAACSRPS